MAAGARRCAAVSASGAGAARAGARSRARPTACSSTRGFTFARRRRASCPTSPRSASATSTARRTCARAPAARTATTSSITTRSTPSSASARGLRALRRRAARPRHGADPRLRAQPHGHHGRRQRLVDGRARERRGLGVRRLLRHRLAPAKPELRDKVLLPVLGDHYGVVLERGELELALRARGGLLRGLLPRASLPARAAHLSARPATARWRQSPNARAREHLPARSARCPTGATASAEQIGRAAPRQGGAQAAPRAARRREPAVAAAIEAAVRSLNGDAAEPPSFDALHALLERQAYRLAYWRVAADEINYRRFFDINDLAALRIETRRCSRRPTGWCSSWSPRARSTACASTTPTGCSTRRSYFGRLQARVALTARPRRDRRRVPIYVVVEKITAARAPAGDWPVHGTTGYHFANVVNGLLVDAGDAQRASTASTARSSASSSTSARSRTRPAPDPAQRARERAQRARQPARAHRRGRPAARATSRSTACAQALAEVIACFPVYRTYVDRRGVATSDRRYIDWASRGAHAAQPRDRGDRVRLRARGAAARAAGAARRARRSRMRALRDEVPAVHRAGDGQGRRGHRVLPLQPPRSRSTRSAASRTRSARPCGAFHADAAVPRRATGRTTMLATSTHDTKRAEDVRARIDVLSEMPRRGGDAVRRWSRMNRSASARCDGAPAPSRNDEYLLLPDPARQLAARASRDDGGELAAYRERIEAYMLKAVREAKVHTSWINADAAYEEALRSSSAALLEPRDGNLFLADFLRVPARAVAASGAQRPVADAAQAHRPRRPRLLPGQRARGTSRLVDPDNRRPVDYAPAAAPARAAAARPRDNRALAGRHIDDGRCKLYLIWKVLQLRRRSRCCSATAPTGGCGCAASMPPTSAPSAAGWRAAPRGRSSRRACTGGCSGR